MNDLTKCHVPEITRSRDHMMEKYNEYVELMLKASQVDRDSLDDGVKELFDAVSVETEAIYQTLRWCLGYENEIKPVVVCELKQA